MTHRWRLPGCCGRAALPPLLCEPQGRCCNRNQHLQPGKGIFTATASARNSPAACGTFQLSSGMRERLSVEFFSFFFFFKNELTKLQVAVWQSRFSPRLLTPTASDSALSRLPASLFSSCHSNALSLRWLKQILPRGRARRAAQAGQHGSLLWSWHRAGICRIPFLNRGGCRVSLGKEFLLPLLVLFPGKLPGQNPPLVIRVPVPLPSSA